MKVLQIGNGSYNNDVEIFVYGKDPVDININLWNFVNSVENN